MFLNTYQLQWQLSGGNLANDYDVQFSVAQALGVEYPAESGLASGFGITGNEEAKINILCKSVTLPGKQIANMEYSYGGIKYNVAGTETYTGELTLEFYNDREMTTRRFFENWMTAIRSVSVTSEANDEDLYNSTLKITPKTKKSLAGIFQEDVIYDVIGVYPTNLEDLVMDGTNTTELTTTNVTIAYSYWKNKEESGSLRDLIF